jgi:hypothetical protein
MQTIELLQKLRAEAHEGMQIEKSALLAAAEQAQQYLLFAIAAEAEGDLGKLASESCFLSETILSKCGEVTPELAKLQTIQTIATALFESRGPLFRARRILRSDLGKFVAYRITRSGMARVSMICRSSKYTKADIKEVILALVDARLVLVRRGRRSGEYLSLTPEGIREFRP